MKSDQFNIYVDRLHNGNIEDISVSCPSSFLDVEEEELRFVGDLIVEGEAYITDETLVLRLNLSCEAEMPCSICNEPTLFSVTSPNFYHTVPFDEIEGAVFSYGDLVRETLLLETPKFVECAGGQCPHRKDVEKYLKEEEGYRPFADLN